MGYTNKYAFDCIFKNVTLSDCPRFLDSRRMCRLGTLSTVYPEPRQDFGRASLLFSGCTILSAFLAGRVSGEQQGGAAEILSRFGVDRGECIQSTHPRVG